MSAATRPVACSITTYLLHAIDIPVLDTTREGQTDEVPLGLGFVSNIEFLSVWCDSDRSREHKSGGPVSGNSSFGETRSIIKNKC